MFGRATIRLGIGPHSSFEIILFLVGGRARAEARIDPRPLRTSRSTAHGAQVA